MKKRKRTIAVILVIVITIGVLSCSPGLSLRTAVFFYSPKSSVTMEYEIQDGEKTNETKYIITKNAPIEKGTEGELTTWMVYSFGPFHYAKYYGEA